MKQQFLQLILLCSTLIWGTAKATETEPNNTAATANTIALNGTDNGKINTGGDEDWWKVTTTGDGKISVTLSPLSGRYTYAQLYDNNGTSLFVSQYSNGTFTINKDGLATGTYYIRVVCYYNTDTSSYIISNTLTQPVQAADNEPNGTFTQAKVLPLNGSKTGHIGYYYNNLDDTTDWYKITTNAEGQLSWTIAVANGQNVYAQLYDVNGTTFLGGNYTTATATYSKDGLAVGTYFIKISNYFITEFAPYTISNTLTLPAVVTDVEPNGTRAQALNINIGDSAVGHIGYANFNGDDTTDFYKVTIPQDGRIDFTMTSLNGQNIYLQLFDNKGTTFLAGNYTTSTATYSKDGLAAGTYYLKIFTYYLTEFAPYKIKVNLVLPAQANNSEPDSTIALAKTLPLNSTTTGHINYFYNNHRDSVDWYKITTTVDGLIKWTITSHNGQNVFAQLYDNNGTTYLGGNYTPASATFTVDGLAAGTYYLRINTYYTTEWAPYTLTDSLFSYSNANDVESNNKPYLAKTMPANGTVTGHVGFYYNNQRDSSDWHKINYTGSGALSVTANFEPTKLYGYLPTFLQIWKDTLVAPIYSNYVTGASITANLTSLTQGYYWVRVITYYSTNFESYTLTNTFTQVKKASIKVVAADTASTCTSTNTLTFKCSKSLPPYTVQLFRYGIAYGSPVTITNTKNFQFKNLPQGQYSATAFGDGATGTAFGKSTVVNMVPAVTTTSTTNISASSAKVNFTTITCAKFYIVQYHKAGDSAWLTKNSVGNTGIVTLNGLTANTTYKWRVQAADSVGKVVATSKFTDSVSFTTAVLFASANSDGSNSDASTKTIGNGVDVTIYPNPVSTQFTIQYGAANSTTKLTAVLKDMMGNIVWKTNNTTASALSGTRVNTSNLPGGMYMLLITDLSNNTIITKKVIVSK